MTLTKEEQVAPEWQPIEDHDGNENECLIAEFKDNQLYCADRGWWEAGEKHQEWDEVEDGVKVLLDEWQEDGHWCSNHGMIEFPTHFANHEDGDGSVNRI